LRIQHQRASRLTAAANSGPLFAYLNGIATKIDMDIIALNGVDDHVHMLVGLHARKCIAKAMQQLKANSSRWLKDKHSDLRAFQWQEGYGAFRSVYRKSM
jgi:REP element-mobilizing transposase RayT